VESRDLKCCGGFFVCLAFEKWGGQARLGVIVRRENTIGWAQEWQLVGERNRGWTGALERMVSRVRRSVQKKRVVVIVQALGLGRDVT
jgi:hypothetical protein